MNKGRYFLLQIVSTVYLPREDVCVLSVGEDMTWYEDIPDSEARYQISCLTSALDFSLILIF